MLEVTGSLPGLHCRSRTRRRFAARAMPAQIKSRHSTLMLPSAITFAHFAFSLAM
jgi:hypothetical protein